MSAEDLSTLKEVGKISGEAILFAAGLVKPGAKFLDVANAAEKFLKDKGYGCAFPINLSINEQAAHYTPTVDDQKTFGANDLVKVDFGAEKNGILGDGAITVDLSGKHHKMIEAAEKALDSAIATVKHGVSVCDVGKAIAQTIESEGFVAVKNLGGHGVETHDLHAGLFIPNYDNGDFTILEEGMVIAIEPFVTNGKGMITDSDLCEIYTYMEDMPIRSADARKLIQDIQKNHSEEPFAVRWLYSLVDSKFRLYAAISELVKSGAIDPQPTLVEVSGGLVTQAEAQLLVTKEGCEVITRALKK